MNYKTLNECAEPNKFDADVSHSPHATNCESKPQFQSCEGVENLYHAPSADFQGLDVNLSKLIQSLGEPNYCNPMLAGKIVEDVEDPPLPPDRSVIYRYNQGFRAIDSAVTKLFSNVNVIDESGKTFKVPIIWGSQERAVAVIMQQNVRKDNTGVADRIVLPAMSIYTSSYSFPRERYISEMAIDYKRGLKHYDKHGNLLGMPGGSPGWTHKERFNNYDTVLGTTRGIPVDLGYTLTIWTKFWEDMNQILEQVATKFNPLAYIRIQSITNWESTVRIDSVSNNLDMEPGDTNNRVFKFQIMLTAESYVPQPIIRRKSVLKTRTEIIDSISDTDIANVIARIEEEVGQTT